MDAKACSRIRRSQKESDTTENKRFEVAQGGGVEICNQECRLHGLHKAAARTLRLALKLEGAASNVTPQR